MKWFAWLVAPLHFFRLSIWMTWLLNAQRGKGGAVKDLALAAGAPLGIGDRRIREARKVVEVLPKLDRGNGHDLKDLAHDTGRGLGVVQ